MLVQQGLQGTIIEGSLQLGLLEVAVSHWGLICVLSEEEWGPCPATKSDHMTCM